MIFAYIILFTALLLSAVAAYYSIAGLTAIFAAAVIPVIIMGATLELGKVVATVWLHNNWKRINWIFKSYLIPAIVFLMLLTSMGIFGFLSKAHSDQSLVTGDAVSKVAIYDEKIATERENIAQAKKALEQMNAQVDQMLGRTDTERGTDKAVVIRKQQAKERAALQDEITRSQKTIQKLQEERAPFAAEARKVEAEVGPIKYIAALIYGDNPDQNVLERAVRWVIILIVIVFDPLALTLILAANKQFEWARAGRGGWVHDEEEKTDRRDESQEESHTANARDGNLQPQTEHIINDDLAAMNINAEPEGVTIRPWTEEELAALNANVNNSQITDSVTQIHSEEEFFDRARFSAEAIDIMDEKARAEEANAILAEVEPATEPVIDIPQEPEMASDQIEIDQIVDNSQQELLDEAAAMIESLNVEITNRDSELVELQKQYAELAELNRDNISVFNNLKQQMEDLKSHVAEVEAARNVEQVRANQLQGELQDLLNKQTTIINTQPKVDNFKFSNPPDSSFGTEFPQYPKKGDLFLRTDYMPAKLYKYNGERWIELDKNTTDTYAYNDAYIEHLIEKLKSGEYESDDLTEIEKEQIAQYLQERNGSNRTV